MKKLFTLLVMLCTLHIGNACSCFYISDFFCPSVSAYYNPDGNYIIRAEVVSILNQYMDVKVQENVMGEITEEVITVLGQDGLNCNQGLGVFEVGETIILSLSLGGWEADKYDLSGCGRYYLKMENEMINDNIDSTTTSLSYNEFVEFMDHCLETTDINEEYWGKDLEIFPNPVEDELLIRNLDPTEEYQIDLLDAQGRRVKNPAIRSGEEIRLQTQDLPVGVYFLRIRGAGILSRKILKAR